MTLVTVLLPLLQLLFLLNIKLHTVDCQTNIPTIINVSTITVVPTATIGIGSGFKKRTTIPMPNTTTTPTNEVSGNEYEQNNMNDDGSKTTIPITTDGDNSNPYYEIPDENNFGQNEYTKNSNTTNDSNSTSTATLVPSNFTTITSTVIIDSTFSLAPTISSEVENMTFAPTIISDPNSTAVPTAMPTAISSKDDDVTTSTQPTSTPENVTTAPTVDLDTTASPTTSSAYVPFYVNGFSITAIITTIATIM